MREERNLLAKKLERALETNKRLAEKGGAFDALERLLASGWIDDWPRGSDLARVGQLRAWVIEQAQNEARHADH